MKKYLFIYLLVIFFNCNNKQEAKISQSKEVENKTNIQLKDSLIFNEEDKILSISHFENNIKEGYSLIFDEETNIPKYLVEYNDGKRDKVIIEFNNDGKIKSFRSADIFHDGQTMNFHENGLIKEIGNTIKGKANGIHHYFNNEGKLIKKVLYDKGQIIKE